MNQEFGFEIIPFEVDPEIPGEIFEVEGERGRRGFSPTRSSFSSHRPAGLRRQPRQPSHLMGRRPSFSPAGMRRQPVRRPSQSRFHHHRPQRPRGTVFPPFGGVSGPYWGQPEPFSSERVRWIQDSLNQVLGIQLPVTGIMGPETRSAVRSFQSRNGLPVTGTVEPDTEKALLDALHQVDGAAPPAEPQSEFGQDGGELYQFETMELESPTGMPATAYQDARGASLPPIHPVNAKFVSCNPPNDAIGAITGRDPVGTIQKANTRAIELLDRVINQLEAMRKKVVAGANPTAPTVTDAVRQALQRRFRMNAGDRNIWIRRGSGTVDVLIRRFKGARQILADGWMHYVCLGRPAVDFTFGGKTCAGPGCTGGTRAVSCGGISQIVLCAPWWRDPPGDARARLDNQAKTLLHECFHIYFEFIGDIGNLANAHCYDHFVLDLNGLAVPADRLLSCP